MPSFNSHNQAADMIFVSLENWDDIWRRNQFLCAAYAKRYPEAKILFVGLPRDATHGARRGSLRALSPEPMGAVASHTNIHITRPLKIAPSSYSPGRAVNDALFRRHVRQAAASLDITKPVLWLNPHWAWHMAGRMGERCVVYDITDDWTTLTQSPALARRVATQDAALCRRADAVIVCSERLYEMKRDLARRLFLIPNGVDAAHYRQVLDSAGPLPEEASSWEKPVFGYTGTIHPDRVDIDLVESVARRLAQGSIVLIGPNHLRRPERERLARLSNVHLPGAVPYAHLPSFMRAFDVCIAPHKTTPFTESLNPIKLWEYLAAGKPIVATDIAGFRDYPQFVKIAVSPEEFLAACANALKEDPTKPGARRREAEGHSWEARLDAVEAVISQACRQNHAVPAGALV